MNHKRRMRIRKIVNKISNRGADQQWLEDELSKLLEEEEETLDAIPDSFQDGERYGICEESVDLLASAMDALDLCEDEDYSEVVNCLNMIDGVMGH